QRKALGAAPSETGGKAEGDAALEIRGLDIVLNTPQRIVPLVKKADLRVAKGELVGLLGESGSGKSTHARAILGLMQPAIGIAAGQILL
ncbi:ATP-binding cassette domain-containing protein, partial [Leucobacter celer]|uniref:ATP-binding cassette domain-containing protein n=1 Tax=Leucobacter celer TaxID=668625 RepID=UPI000A433993